MIFNACRALCFSCFIFLFVFCLDTYGSQTPPLSAMRIQKISKIISKYKEAGENLSDNDVVNTVLKDVSELYRLEPEAKRNTKTTQDIGKMVREKVALKFTDNYETVKKKAETEAEKTFVMAKILDYVSVKYLKGEKPNEVEGCFFSYGSTNNSVNIGGTIIAMYDIVPNDRIRFDEVFRNEKRESFVKTKIRDYYSEKNAYSIQVYNEVRDAVIKENEENGYIFYMNDWRNPREVALFLIRDMPASVPEKGDKTASAAGTAGEPAPDKEDNSITKKREEIRKIAEAKQIENTTKNAGIDADQGYELAYWGMKKDEFALLYPQYSAASGTGDIEIITYEKDPLFKLEFHFTSDLFYKVVYVFRKPGEAILAIGRKIKDKYGLTDQEKLDAAEPEKANSTEAAVAQEQIYTWTGKETKGQLTIRLSSDKKSYTDFILTRENPKIKKLSDEIAIGIEQKKKKEAEDQRKKDLEEYNKFKL